MGVKDEFVWRKEEATIDALDALGPANQINSSID